MDTFTEADAAELARLERAASRGITGSRTIMLAERISTLRELRDRALWRWESVENTVRTVTRLLEHSDTATAPDTFRSALAALDRQLERWQSDAFRAALATLRPDGENGQTPVPEDDDGHR